MGIEVVHGKLSCASPFHPVEKLAHICHSANGFWTLQSSEQFHSQDVNKQYYVCYRRLRAMLYFCWV
jgi:hypothetical protein